MNQNEIMESNVKPVVRNAELLVVENDAGLQIANKWLGEIKKAKKVIKDSLGVVVKKAHEAHKEAKRVENDVMTPLKEAENLIKAKMGKYYTEQEVKAEAERKRLSDIAEQERQAAEELASENPEEAVDLFAEVEVQHAMDVSMVSSPPKLAGTSFVEKWSATVVDFNALPDEYKIANLSMLNQVARATKGKLDIPGVKMEVTKTVRH